MVHKAFLLVLMFFLEIKNLKYGLIMVVRELRSKLLDWIVKVQDLGAGEIILSSINNDGTGKGFNIRF